MQLPCGAKDRLAEVAWHTHFVPGLWQVLFFELTVCALFPIHTEPGLTFKKFQKVFVFFRGK